MKFLEQLLATGSSFRVPEFCRLRRGVALTVGHCRGLFLRESPGLRVATGPSRLWELRLDFFGGLLRSERFFFIERQSVCGVAWRGEARKQLRSCGKKKKNAATTTTTAATTTIATHTTAASRRRKEANFCVSISRDREDEVSVMGGPGKTGKFYGQTSDNVCQFQ